MEMGSFFPVSRCRTGYLELGRLLPNHVSGVEWQILSGVKPPPPSWKEARNPNSPDLLTRGLRVKFYPPRAHPRRLRKSSNAPKRCCPSRQKRCESAPFHKEHQGLNEALYSLLVANHRIAMRSGSILLGNQLTWGLKLSHFLKL